jgi:hypothetical protein
MEARTEMSQLRLRQQYEHSFVIMIKYFSVFTDNQIYCRASNILFYFIFFTEEQLIPRGLSIRNVVIMATYYALLLKSNGHGQQWAVVMQNFHVAIQANSYILSLEFLFCEETAK